MDYEIDKFDILEGEDGEGAEESGGLCEIRLKDFDGPFDTLCHLIKKSKYSLEDVRISDITEQYMEYMKQIEELDLESATGFITMASWLLEIKSRALLPRPEAPPEEEDDPEKTLKQQLAEYSLFKEASQKMKEIETVDILYRAPDDTVGQPRFILKSMNTEGLMSALQRVFLKLEQRAGEIRERHIVKDSFTVEEKIAHIKDRLMLRESVFFFDLFENALTKSEVIATFLALLELLKAQYLTSEQKEIYGDILLRRLDKPQDEVDSELGKSWDSYKPQDMDAEELSNLKVENEIEEESGENKDFPDKND